MFRIMQQFGRKKEEKKEKERETEKKSGSGMIKCLVDGGKERESLCHFRRRATFAFLQRKVKKLLKRLKERCATCLIYGILGKDFG